MVPEFERLAERGWQPPAADDRGVFDVNRPMGESISYPESGLEVLGLDAGSGYWFDHRARAIIAAVRNQRVSTMWDIGAGTGSVAARLAEAGIDVVAVEPLLEGAAATAQLGIPSLCGTLDSLRLPDGCLRAVGMFDVVEHIEDPAPLLREVARVLEPGGSMVVTVPAFRWLWGDEDDVAGHYRRYTIRSLRTEAARAGFRFVRGSYLFASLVPVAAVVRALPYRLGRRQTEEQVFAAMRSQLTPSATVERMLGWAFATEDSVARSVNLPFGLSVLGVFTRA